MKVVENIKTHILCSVTFVSEIVPFDILKSTGHVMHQQFNILKPTGYVMYQQFNIQQLYVLPTLYFCVLCLSENKQRLVTLTS